jgi:hypothetical protein
MGGASSGLITSSRQTQLDETVTLLAKIEVFTEVGLDGKIS